MTYTNIDKISAELNGMVIDNSTTPSLDSVNNWISEASSIIDRKAGKSFKEKPYIDLIDIREGDEGVFRTSNAPIIRITKVEYNTASPGNTPVWVEKVEDVDFYTYEQTGELEVTPRWCPTSGNKKLRITYDAGYETVPVYISSLASKIVAKRIISAKLNEQSSVDGGAISVGSISISDPTVFSISNIKQLNFDIDEGFKNIVGGVKVPRYTRY